MNNLSAKEQLQIMEKTRNHLTQKYLKSPLTANTLRNRVLFKQWIEKLPQSRLPPEIKRLFRQLHRNYMNIKPVQKPIRLKDWKKKNYEDKLERARNDIMTANHNYLTTLEVDEQDKINQWLKILYDTMVQNRPGDENFNSWIEFYNTNNIAGSIRKIWESEQVAGRGERGAITCNIDPNSLNNGNDCYFFIRSNKPDTINRNLIMPYRVGDSPPYNKIINIENPELGNPWLLKSESNGAVSTWGLGYTASPYYSMYFGERLNRCWQGFTGNSPEDNSLTLYIIPKTGFNAPSIQQSQDYFKYDIGEGATGLKLTDNARMLIVENSNFVGQLLWRSGHSKTCNEYTIIGDVPHIKINFGINEWKGWGEEVEQDGVVTYPNYQNGLVIRHAIGGTSKKRKTRKSKHKTLKRKTSKHKKSKNKKRNIRKTNCKRRHTK